MKVPIRPAPPPPVNQKIPPKSASSWDSLGNQDPWSKSIVPVQQKKKPPPRPPPPKFPNKKSVPSRPSQLIAGLFQRKNNVNNKLNDIHITRPTLDTNVDSKGTNGMLLIDFNSPPSSPTFTTRSSSDALSVNSFGSDGVTQGSGSSGNTSNVESGFEDDFDLFSSNGGGGATSKKNDGFQPRDPWSPPPPSKPNSEQKNFASEKSWVTFPSPSSSKKLPLSKGSMPTIIRSKPDAFKTQQKVNNSLNVKSSGINKSSDAFQPATFCNFKPDLNSSIFEEDDNDVSWSSESPPMPTCPPPPPPPQDMLSDFVEDFNSQAKIVDDERREREREQEQQQQQQQQQRSYGIALYDYTGEQIGDLSFRKDDVINLVRRIDENWLVGEMNGREGSVPANFITIRIPPPGEEDDDAFVTALYPFQPEAWDDLEFEEGSVIKVTHRIDQDWLYGECNGKVGQFPGNFVDRIPNNLPVKKLN